MTTGVTEQALLFGKALSLVGVITHPVSGMGVRGPAVVILNTGIVHRVGHHRMYVTLARLLASAGHHVLRFDLSGIGDSRNRGGGLDLMACALTDVSEAIDQLARSSGAREFVVIGLCSGADIALRYARTDCRVCGLVLLDPTIPPTARFYLDYIVQRLTSLQSWLTFASGRGRIWRDMVAHLRKLLLPKTIAGEHVAVEPGLHAELEPIYATLVEQRTRFLVVLAGDAHQGRQSYREQLLDAFPKVPFGDSLSLEHFESSDHIFTAAAERVRLNRLVLGWMAATPFGRRGAGDAAPQAEDRVNGSSVSG